MVKWYRINMFKGRVLLPGRKYIIVRGVKRYQWDILPITVRHEMTDTNT